MKKNDESKKKNMFISLIKNYIFQGVIAGPLQMLILYLIFGDGGTEGANIFAVFGVVFVYTIIYRIIVSFTSEQDFTTKSIAVFSVFLCWFLAFNFLDSNTGFVESIIVAVFLLIPTAFGFFVWTDGYDEFKDEMASKFSHTWITNDKGEVTYVSSFKDGNTKLTTVHGKNGSEDFVTYEDNSGNKYTRKL